MNESAENDQKRLDAYAKIWSQWNPDSIADQIQDHQTRRSVYLDLIAKWATHQNKKDVRIMEIGCGTSIDTHILAQKLSGEAFAIDISKESIAKAEQVAKHFKKSVNLSVQDCLNMNFDDDTFDLIFSQGVLEHFNSPYLAVKEQLRVLKSGGILIISVPQTFTMYTVYKHLLMLFGKWPWGKETEFSNRGLKRIGSFFNLEILEFAGYDYWKHICEPMYVLSTLNQKRQKVLKENTFRMVDAIFNRYDRFFNSLERKFGIYFMKNIVFVYRKNNS